MMCEKTRYCCLVSVDHIYGLIRMTDAPGTKQGARWRKIKKA